MPKTFLLYLLLAFPLLGISQVTLTSLNVNHPDSNVVFIGIDNYLEVGAVGSGKDIRLSSSKASASVSKVSPARFLIRVSTIGDTPFELYDYSTSPRKLLLSKSFTAQVLPSPEAQIGATADSALTIADILSNPTIQVRFPNSSYQHSFTITSFVLAIRNANGDVMHAFDRTENNRLTNEQINAIQGLSKGDQLYFTQLVATCPNCKSFTLPSTNTYIK